MENWIMDIMNQFGYLGVFLLICIENLFPPIPSEIILTFGGFSTHSTNLTVLGVIFYATLGSVIGAVILYWLGRILHIERLEKIVDRWGHLLRLQKEDLYRADRWFQKYGYWTVFFCRMIPLLRSLISIPAGISKMNFWIFIFFTTVGTIIWNSILVGLGAKLGENWETIVYYMDIYSNIVYAILAMIIIGVIIYFFCRGKNKQV